MNDGLPQRAVKSGNISRLHRIVVCALWTASILGASVRADDALPEGSELLEVIVVPERVPARRALAAGRQRIRENPGNLAIVIDYTRACVEAFRIEGDPRHLSHAEAALRPWWHLDSPPPEVRLWRAMIRQSRHQFGAARRDLEALTRERPDQAQAWLTLATVLVVMGEVEEARVCCQPLRALAGDFVFTVADAGVASLTGEGEVSRQRLLSLLSGSPLMPLTLRAWATGVLAEICDRLGRGDEAESYYRAARGLDADDPYALVAWADFLLEQGRFREVDTALSTRRDHHGLLLRWLCAKAQLGEWDAGYVDGVVSLRAAEIAAAARGETGHAREEARMHLELLDDPQVALERATRNWRVQREPADARLLVACAIAAGQPAAADPVLEWRRSVGMEDVILDRLVSTLKAMR